MLCSSLTPAALHLTTNVKEYWFGSEWQSLHWDSCLCSTAIKKKSWPSYMLQLDTINISSQTANFLVNFCLSFMNDIERHIKLPAATPRWYSTLKCCQVVSKPHKCRSSDEHARLFQKHVSEAAQIFLWAFQTLSPADTNSEGKRRYHLDFWLIESSKEQQKSVTNKTKDNKSTGRRRWHEKKHTWFQLSYPEDLCHISASNWWMQSCDLTDDSHYSNTLIRFVPRMQKCNIMSDKLSHYLSAWNKRMAFIRNVMTTNCCTESMWHDAQFLMSCMADI